MPRTVIGVVAPATNIMVQPEMEALRPPGVVNAHARIPNPDRAVASDADTLAVRADMVAGLSLALATLRPARPAAIVLGVMVENFVDDPAALLARCAAEAGCPVLDYTGAVREALAALFPGRPARLGVLTPFMPVGDAAARRLFEAAGHAVVRLEGLRAPSPTAIADLPEPRLRAALDALDGPDLDAIVQVGTNLDFAALAAREEARRGKPVLAANPVLYRAALRRLGLS